MKQVSKYFDLLSPPLNTGLGSQTEQGVDTYPKLRGQSLPHFQVFECLREGEHMEKRTRLLFEEQTH